MGIYNDDLSLKLTKAIEAGFFPDVRDEEVEVLRAKAFKLFGFDNILTAKSIPTMSTFTRYLDANLSAAISFYGDSTGDGEGNPVDRIPTRFARTLGKKYTNHHILAKKYDAATNKFKSWVTIKSHPAGRRYVNITAHGLRWVPPVFADAANTTQVYDIGALIDPTTYTPATTGNIINRGRKEVAGSFSNELVIGLRLKTTGQLGLMRSVNGTSWASEQLSTIPVPGTVGTPIWVRAVVTINPGVSGDIKFYTAPENDNENWTQLGTTLNLGAATAIWTPVEGSFFEIGAENWPSNGAQFSGKIYEVFFRDGLDGPTVAPCNIESWERAANANTTYGGAPTIYLINAAQSGSNMADHNVQPRLNKESPNYGQTAFVINDGHNESVFTGETKWIAPYKSWVDNIKARLPKAQPNVIGQSAHTSLWVNEASYGPEHITRIMELSVAAEKYGWGFINLYQAFLDDPRGLSVLISNDGLHPSQEGYDFAGDVVARYAGVG
ncbi:hydrolase [Arthrobacter phage Casserole]|nr:hydrolase [Arthrobacter phage Casserole]